MLHKYETLTKLVYYSGPIKIMAAKGKQNVGPIMSGERGTNIIVGILMACSESLPLYLSCSLRYT